MKLNVFFVIVLSSLVFCSCAVDKKLEYHVLNNDVSKNLRKHIAPLKKSNKEIILVLDREDSLNIITIRPTSYRYILNFPIAHSNRYMIIDGHKYTVIFDFDYELGVRSEKSYEDGMLIVNMKKQIVINEYEVRLKFDKNWNFLYSE